MGTLARGKGVWQSILFCCLLLVLTVACASEPGGSGNREAGQEGSSLDLTLPGLEPVGTGEGPIEIVATTGIIADVVANVAGDMARVEALMAANQDPHAYQTTAADLRRAVEADAVFVNGWRLEEGLIDDLSEAASETPMIPVSAGIEPRLFDEDGFDQEHDQEHNEAQQRVDPHVWLAPTNVIQWVDNIETSLTSLDPDNAAGYARTAELYREQLRELDTYYQERLADVPSESRMLVTNHDSFGYFAESYGFEVIGTVLPGDSTLAEPASGDLAALIQRMKEARTCAIFVETSASQQLARQLAEELDHCQSVQVVTLYSGALGGPGSGAETYLQMMRANVDEIVRALQTERQQTGEG